MWKFSLILSVSLFCLIFYFCNSLFLLFAKNNLFSHKYIQTLYKHNDLSKMNERPAIEGRIKRQYTHKNTVGRLEWKRRKLNFIARICGYGECVCEYRDKIIFMHIFSCFSSLATSVEENSFSSLSLKRMKIWHRRVKRFIDSLSSRVRIASERITSLVCLP